MKLLWFVSTTEDTNFLKEFSKSFSGTIDVFHLNFITRFSLLGFKGKHFYPIAPRKFRNNDICVANTFNVLSGRLNQFDASAAYASTDYILNANANYLRNSVFIIPSGRHVHHAAARAFAMTNDLKSIYINYSNFPGYTFFDPKGTDCKSLIYAEPSVLDELFSDVASVEDVFLKFSELKENQSIIPQATTNGLVKHIKKAAFVFDTTCQYLAGLYGDRRVKLLAPKLHEALDIDYDDLPDGEYLFFPLQVSTDQQVLVNYAGGSIFKAIDQAIGIAKESNTTLCVREHPAEGNKAGVRKYLNEQRLKFTNLRVVDVAVPAMIDGCSKVITINSTVGLEARLKKKSVIFLGDSFYSKASDQQLAKYLDHYIVDTDYHKPKINADIVSKILRKLG